MTPRCTEKKDANPTSRAATLRNVSILALCRKQSPGKPGTSQSASVSAPKPTDRVVPGTGSELGNQRDTDQKMSGKRKKGTAAVTLYSFGERQTSKGNRRERE